MAQVKYLEYNKKKIPYRVKYLALKAWKDETGKSLKDIDDLLENIELLEPLFWHSVVSGYRILGKENPYKRKDEEFILILDECWIKFASGMKDFFQ